MKRKNPLLRDPLGDPFILKEGKDYYLSGTGGCGKRQQSFSMYHSTNLQDWSDGVVILEFPEDVTWAKAGAWAPSMAKYQGSYYFSFVADQQIGIAVCDTPMGRYKDILGKPLIDAWTYDCQVIDPCLFVDDDGKIWLLFGQGKCWIVELDLAPDHAAFIGEPTCLSDFFFASRSIRHVKQDNTIYNEAPDLVKINGKYLFSWAVYDVCDPRYRTLYAWSKSITGPYIQQVDGNMELDNVLIHGEGDIQCTGHSCITEYDGEYYVFYGRYPLDRWEMTRELCYDKIDFITDRKLRATPTK